MPTFTFTSPEGKSYDITGPEGSTKEQAFQILQQKIGGAKPASPEQPPAEKPSMNLGQANPIAEPLMAMGTGMIAKPVSDVAGLAALAAAPFSGGRIDPTAVKRRVQDAMTYEPKSDIAKAAMYPVEKIGEAMDWASKGAGDIVKRVGGSGPIADAVGNAVTEAINQAPGFIGMKGGKLAEAKIPRAQAALDIAKGENSMIDAARAKAISNGYKVPAEGGVKGAMADLYGRAREARHLSAVNTENATRRISGEIGLAPGEAPSAEALGLKKDAAHEKYQQLVDISGPKLTSQPAIATFKSAVGKSLEEIDAMMAHDPEGYAGLKQPARLLRSWLKKDDFDTARTLQSIKDLRADAKGHFINNERYLATAKLGLANQLENLFEGHLAETGNAAAVQEMKNARTQLAKINFLERVLNPETGRVDLAKIGNLSQTKAYKGALTGELKNAADFAIGFKRGAQKVVEAPPQLSVFDGLFAAGALFAGHPTLAAGEIGSRLAAPAAIRAGLLQAKTPTYKASRAAPVAIPSAAIAAQVAAQNEAAKRRAEAALAP